MPAVVQMADDACFPEQDAQLGEGCNATKQEGMVYAAAMARERYPR